MPELSETDLRKLFQVAGHQAPASDLTDRIMARVAVAPIVRLTVATPLISKRAWITAALGLGGLVVLVTLLPGNPSPSTGPASNMVAALYVFLLVPEYLLRFAAWIVSRVMYRFRVTGDENIPEAGAAIVVCNHVSFVDALLLMAASPRPIRFVMDHQIFRTPVLGTR